MSRKWIAGLVALAALGGTAFATSAVLSSGAGARPAYATVAVDLSRAAPATARANANAPSSKPKVVYLQSSDPTTINPAPPPTGTGAFVDVKLTGCSKVVDGGVVPSDTNVYVQGSYVKSRSEYHVLIGLDDAAQAAPAQFTITSYLTCLKGAR